MTQRGWILPLLLAIVGSLILGMQVLRWNHKSGQMLQISQAFHQSLYVRESVSVKHPSSASSSNNFKGCELSSSFRNSSKANVRHLCNANRESFLCRTNCSHCGFHISHPVFSCVAGFTATDKCIN